MDAFIWSEDTYRAPDAPVVAEDAPATTVSRADRIALLAGIYPDGRVARWAGCSIATVRAVRVARGIPAWTDDAPTVECERCHRQARDGETCGRRRCR